MASFGSTPFAIRSRPRTPYSTIVEACVQTAPMPARTTAPRGSQGTRVVTAAPDWPWPDRSRSEKVELRIAGLVHRDAVGGAPGRSCRRRLPAWRASARRR
jgi:hypothetical protein